MYIIHKFKPGTFLRSFAKILVSKPTMSTSSCTVAVCQMTSTTNKEENLQSVKNLVERAVTQNAKVIFLPEGCDYLGNSKEEIKSLAETLEGNLVQQYKQMAKTKNVWLSIGGFHEIIQDATSNNNNLKLYNSHIIINSNGEIVSVYRKLHLFDVCIPEKNINLKESDNVAGGTEIVPPVETPAGLVGLAICYDLRFPELSILLRSKGAHILTFPSAFTKSTGQAHWEILLRARAIENQCYVLAATQYGKHNEKRISYGQAMIIDPWGNILAECPKYSEEVPSNESLAIADIKTDFISKVRMDMPVFQHRRADIYKITELTNEPVLPDCQSTYAFADKIIHSGTVFYCTKRTFAFTNIRCVVPGHVLVSPIRVARRLEDLTEEELADLFQATVKVQKVMEEVQSAFSSTICVQDGQSAGQTVPHIHCHVLPRKPGDFERNDDVYQELARHDRDERTPIRPMEEMMQEANYLRTFFYKF